MNKKNSCTLTRGHPVPWGLLLLVLVFPCFVLEAADQQQFSEEVELCLSCHNDPTATMDLADGQVSVYLDPAIYGSSVHGQKLNCTDCHTDITDYPHPERSFKNQREINLALYESCKKCHFENYTKTLEGIHYAMLAKGDSRAPTCVDCHGSHEISSPNRPRVKVSNTCNQCHADVYQTYKESVHGKSMLNGGINDAPVCTDCHKAHDIEDPRTANFLLKTPELCGQCHSDEAKMKKYGLSTHVVSTYLKDFHGVSASFHKGSTDPIDKWKAVCTDCHGVHNIKSVDATDSPVLKANLVQTCSKCHPDATPEFPDSWLSHYEPTPKKAALVFYVSLFYKFFIPFTIVGLLLHVFLSIWRFASNR